MSDDNREPTSLELFNQARERGDTIGDSWRDHNDASQIDLLPPPPQPKWLVLSLDGHRVGVVKETNAEFRALCSCGAVWTHKASENTRTMEAIFTAHVAYDKHQPIKPL